ncbi:MAG: AAA family ATPase [Pegethrix bostrychoides GSE-TBD4-15B]|jgi:putative ATP-dependent endonuclease of OLD family|uniref:AAA family ATPase n=1 Tax=Pegethrix bostrychoides GSE-TBD4-15B TaxID=2839662 RepID=A0A951P7Y7_9CYAN|nr:AAA family ATPase [Pegethrix bostrychoides GSE-TBD4-15B]
MKISKLEISNYRNLNEIKIRFHPNINFIIGENNIGKSNLLDLLNILFNRNNFAEPDFQDLDKQIDVKFSLELSEIEQGFFEDLFDPSERGKINIVAIQESPDEEIKFHHEESGTAISKKIIRCVNYISYDSLRNPPSELSFSKNKGVGKFLNHIIVRYLKDTNLQDTDFIIPEKIGELLTQVNQSLQKIKSFKDFSVQAVGESNKENLLAKLILLADSNNQSLDKLGYGVQFSIIITLSILERLLSLNKQHLERCTIKDDLDSENCIPILIGLDEPEIHLHPYAQRSLIKYLDRIVSNKEPDFISLLEDIFKVSKLLGQILVVSHSPNILLNDYRHLIRFCKDDAGVLIVKNGIDIDLEEKIEKQLLKNLPYVKEAFFSKVVILVEGESELGALPIFFERLGIDSDELGISVIQAGGAESIPPLMKLLDKFSILNLGLMDTDKKTVHVGIPNLHFTQGIDFEEDMYHSFDIIDYIKYLEEEYPDERKAHCFIGKARDIEIIFDPKDLIHPQLNSLPSDKIQELKETLKDDILRGMKSRKGIICGRDLGSYVTEVPQIYEDLIKKAVELSTNAK